MNTRVLRLTNGQFTLVDADMFEFLKTKTWRVHSNGYIATGEYNPETQKAKIKYLHRLVNQTPEGMHTDHIDGNKRNNTRANLRSCTRTQNMMNQRTQTRNKYSKYKGVSWCKQHRCWVAGVKMNRKRTNLGLFKTEVDAAKAYNLKALEFFGSFAKLNII